MFVNPNQPSKIFLAQGESLLLEPGAMLAFQNCTMKTEWVAGSFFKKCKQYLLGGEHMLRNRFQAESADAWVALEEQMPGQIQVETVKAGEPALIIRQGAYLGNTENVQFETKYQGISGYMKGKGIGELRAFVNEDEGQVFFHTHGSVVEKISINSESGPVIIDNGSVLAHSSDLECTLRRPGAGIGSFFFSSEGFVCEFKGKGFVYVSSGQQTGSDNLVTGIYKETARQVGEYLSMAIFASALGAIFWWTRGVSPFDLLVATVPILNHRFQN